MARQGREGTDSTVCSDDESIPDNVSVASFASTRLDENLDGEPDGEVGDDGFYDDFEDKIQDAIENASEKSVKTRIIALEYITRAFRTRYLFEFIEERYVF